MPYLFRHPQLAHETTLVLDEQNFAITLLQAGERVTQSRFIEQEWRVLTPFFSPEKGGMHCTYEEALAALIGLPVALCRERIRGAKLKDEYEETVKHAFFAEMKPVRELLFSCQDRLHALDLHLCGLLHYGYVLCPLPGEGHP
jgi:hypothetical protein